MVKPLSKSIAGLTKVAKIKDGRNYNRIDVKESVFGVSVCIFFRMKNKIYIFYKKVYL